ncbi:flavin-containing monooxygenase [Aspergillus fijiensis CBS 313.89]|uniref:FAD/NAD(P)-binding domain-containing protein n=1 Tax=Aspergillus fijiensis CBS 313.89 TaxID=1448319 RepID=A0A8G1RTZ9_9EURO|nr:FAD/NAD(P)-binding domain-containing protein [Aspergillus fijiensis CBS 313.89]RAK78839.1 FAD/NAD(P)-binding domain-containing protein [Aspergillus fijiensis CBS 313.89]
MQKHEFRSDWDIIIVGAGLAGINMAYRVQNQLPHCRYLVIESKSTVGGTWDTFHYPGLRADSDIYTYSYTWFPWNQKTKHPDRESVSRYLAAAASSFRLGNNILFNHKLHSAHWSSSLRQWELVCHHYKAPPSAVGLRTKFLIFCTGIFDHNEARPAEIAGLNSFAGPVIHPQFWPDDLDYSGKHILLIGSGATAMTLLPDLAHTAGSVTLVQRSPGYLLTLPERRHRKNGSWHWVHHLKWVLWMIVLKQFFQLCHWFPGLIKRICVFWARWQLPAHVPVDPHFIPAYNPWEQRPNVCFGWDMFRALKGGRALIETGHIANVDRHGLRLQSGKYLQGDIIVTATGLKLQFAGGVRILVDEIEIDLGERLAWNGAMVQDIPNVGFVAGYAHTSWTLGADMRAQLICRVIREMEKNGVPAMVPRFNGNVQAIAQRPVWLKSSYILAQEQCLPRVGRDGPWKARNTYLTDYLFGRYSRRVLEGLECV